MLVFLSETQSNLSQHQNLNIFLFIKVYKDSAEVVNLIKHEGVSIISVSVALFMYFL